MRGLYIHIPFCKQICSYCDFPKMVSKKENMILYFNALKEELKIKEKDLKNIDTVYIGGGTPNLLPDSMLEEFFLMIKPYLDHSKESTIECNPELITKSQVALFKKYKINRVSLGVQTTNSNLLELLGRKHKKEDVDLAYKLLKDEGIRNISMDFIFGLPNQSMDMLKEDLNYVFEKNLTHASFYSLILEDKTIFSYLVSKKKLSLPDDDFVADMYDYINRSFKDHGYQHYEISNYAKEGFLSIHNSLYWKCEEYVAIGMGASGYIKPYRYTNYKTLKKYLTLKEEERIFISLEDEKKEFMMLGLRMTKGISMSNYEAKFGGSPILDFSLDKLLANGMLKLDGDWLYIPEEKLFIANIVYEEFV